MVGRMNADPKQVMRILEIRHVEVRLIGGNLKMRAVEGQMPADMVEFVRHNRALIVAELQERERLAETVTNAMELTDAEFGQWVSEIRAASPDDANLAHDWEALRQIRRLQELARWAAEDQEAA